MPIYNYKAKGPTGNQATGTMDADNERVLASKLKAQKLVLVSATVETKKKFKL
jgi:type II secretory pathway component PulF